VYRIHQCVACYLANSLRVLHDRVSQGVEELAVEICELGVLEDALELPVSFILLACNRCSVSSCIPRVPINVLSAANCV
jgi:hypothetical protein